MGNTLLTPTAITRKALSVIHNKLAFVANIDKQHDNKHTFGGQKDGGSIQIRKPPQYTVREGAVINVQNATETYTTLNVDKQRGVDLNFTSTELTLDIDDFSERFLEPALSRLATYIDADAFSMFKSVYNTVGAAGTIPTTALVYLQGGQKLDEYVTPRDGMRNVIINPAAQAKTVDALKSLFHSGGDVSKQYKSGTMGSNVLGFDNWSMSQNVPSITTGSRTGSVLVDGTSNEGTTVIHMDAFTGATDTIKKGEVFTVAGVYAVNPESKQTLGALQQFVVTEDFAAVSNEGDVSVSPTLYTSTSGAVQTISALPTNEAVITFLNTTASTTYDQNLCFHKNAFTFATANMEMPSGVDFASRNVLDGISMRIVRDYDINNDSFPCRIDVLYGYLAQRVEWAARIQG